MDLAVSNRGAYLQLAVSTIGAYLQLVVSNERKQL